MTFAKYLEAGKINFFNSIMYFWDFLSSAIFVALILFIFTSLWKTIYGAGDDLIVGFTINMMMWYMVMTESIVVSAGRPIEEIGEEIQSGQIAQHLNKPYNYLLFKYCAMIMQVVLRFVLTFAIGSVVVLIFLGGLKVQLIHVPFIALIVLLALTLHLAIMIFLGVLVFWTEDAHSIHFVYQKIVFVLGGMLVPLEIFPAWLEQISRMLPFSYIAYYPAKLFVNFSWHDFWQVLAGELGWILLLILLITILYKICIKKISVNGG